MDTKNQILMIDTQTLANWLEFGNACLYDVRENHEYARARIPGSMLLPLSIFTPDQVLIPPEKKLIFHCRSGVRCGQAANIMQVSGFKGPIYRLEGGIIAWQVNGGEIKSGDS
jgi:rhodanese-related sulfurtransferase